MITGTTAEGIEAKAGTSDGIIEGNVIDGTRMTAATSGGWIVVKGNGWLVDYNQGPTSALENGFTATYSKVRLGRQQRLRAQPGRPPEPDRLRRLACRRTSATWSVATTRRRRASG